MDTGGLRDRGGAVFLGDYAEALPLHRRNYDAAEARFADVIDIFRRLGDEGRAGLATGLMEYGTLLGRRGLAEEQIRAQREALSLRLALYGERHPDYVAVLNNVANAYYSLDELDEAARHMQQNIRLSGEIFGTDTIPHGVALLNFATLQHRLGDYGEAIDIDHEAEPIYRQGYGETHPRYAYMHENMANSLEQVGDFEGAEESYLKAREILSGQFGAEHLAARGKPALAEAHLRVRRDTFAAEFGDTHEHTQRLADALSAYD